MPLRITDLQVLDIRFPTAAAGDGSDALNAGDYSATYVILRTSGARGVEGHGITFTNGRGNEICVSAVHALKHHVIGQTLESITANMRTFYQSLTLDNQLRWLGPEKGVIHLSTAAILNAVWDLWAKIERKPLWQLLADMPARQLVDCIDFTYITDALTPDEATDILERNSPIQFRRAADVHAKGYPAYTTSTGWIGYPDAKVRKLCDKALAQGWTHFKMKVGKDLAANRRRAALMREAIGDQNVLMMDANQCWGVDEAIEQMTSLADFNPWWIEEPTSPDDVLGHATIAKAIAPIGVATGEACQNRVIFKQLFQAKAISFCQVDTCRLGSVNEWLAVVLMAAKFKIPVCPHAGGVGLCEYAQHVSIFDYLCASGTMKGRVLEYVDHLHKHFIDPVKIKNARYQVPTFPGYSITMKPQSLIDYQYPAGRQWAAL